MIEITAEQLKLRMDNKESLNLIDVREQWEYEEFNIGGLNIPISVFIQRMEELEDLKEKEIIVHCKMGGRTMQAVTLLEQSGFKNVVAYTGGMEEWKMKYGSSNTPR